MSDNMEITEKRGRGRPPGRRNGERLKPLVPIKNWKPWMTKVVILHMARMPHCEIAKQFTYTRKDGTVRELTVVRISQIINDPQGQQMIRGMNAQVKESMLSDIGDGMVVLAHKSMERLKETLEYTVPAGTDAKKHQDHVALQLTKNITLGASGETENQKAPSYSEEVVNRFAAALEKVAATREIHGAKEIIVNDERKVG